jgi:hypothetical protein
MNRKLRIVVPITREQRTPRVPDMVSLQAREKQLKENQKEHFDRHCGVRDLTQLMPGD